MYHKVLFVAQIPEQANLVLAAKVALAKTKRPSRIYLYRRKKIMTYSITYVQKDGKVKAVAKLLRTKSVVI